MREVSVANDRIRARCWQNPYGCGVADLAVEDNFVNGMSGGRGWAAPAFSLISNHTFGFHSFYLCRSTNVSAVWISTGLDFGIINPVLVVWTPRLCRSSGTLFNPTFVSYQFVCISLLKLSDLELYIYNLIYVTHPSHV